MIKLDDIYSFNTGVIITDKQDIILSFNSTASKLLNLDISKGRLIKYYLPYISSKNLYREITKDFNVYFFGMGDFKSISSKIFENIETGVFIADINGNIIFSNTYLKKIFNSSNTSNIFDIFKAYNINIKSFNLVTKSKKEVIYELKFSETKTYSLTLIPIDNPTNDIVIISGIISETSYSENLKEELALTKEELKKYKISYEKKAITLEKPNLKLKSKVMTELYDVISNLSYRDITILLLGKSGTGKSSIAKKIHNQSLRKNKPFVTINCASLPETLIESELFGYEKGAFTGALSSGKKGLIEIAEGGTLFIDEIGELPIHTQGKLLELVQERTYRPVGSTQNKTADVRIITATNVDLYNLVSEKRFREDLYYRIAVAVINIPTLSEHPEDIKLLIESFTIYFNRKYETNVSFSIEAKNLLSRYDWPGNIRELEHMIEFLIIRSSNNLVDVDDLPMDIIKINTTENKTKNELNIYEEKSFKSYTEDFESNLIRTYYKKYPSSYKLSKALEISQTKANKLIQRYCR